MVYDPDKWKRFFAEKRDWGKDIDLWYRLETMGMHDRWQVQEEENVDASNPMNISLYIPETTKLVKQVLLRVKLKRWRSYAWRTRPLAASEISFVTDTGFYSGGVATWTSTDGAHIHSASTTSAGSHNHAGAVATDGSHTHSVSIGSNGAHNHEIQEHTHLAELPEGMSLHLEHSIALGATAADFFLHVNGVDITFDLGGPWTTDQTNLDITAHVQPGWNDIELRCSGQGRLHATAFVDLYIP